MEVEKVYFETFLHHLIEKAEKVVVNFAEKTVEIEKLGKVVENFVGKFAQEVFAVVEMVAEMLFEIVVLDYWKLLDS